MKQTVTAHALWITARQQATIQAQSLSIPVSPQQCLVQSEYSLISSGTEQLVYHGEVPPELHKEMVCPYMEGQFSFPIKYGYSLVGKVISGPPSLHKRRVHLLHPHQDLCLVASQDLSLIPEQIPSLRATLASNVETVVNALWDSEIQIGEKVLVVGFGNIGALLAQVLRQIPGVSLVICESLPSKRQLAQNMGFVTPALTEFAPATSHKFDLAFHTSSSAAGLQTAIDAVAFEGRVIEVSWFGKKPVTLSLGGSFHSQRKRIIASQVSHLPAKQQKRWDQQRRKELVWQLLQNPLFDQNITKQTPFRSLPQTLAQLPEISHQHLGCAVYYGE